MNRKQYFIARIIILLVCTNLFIQFIPPALSDFIYDIMPIPYCFVVGNIFRSLFILFFCCLVDYGFDKFLIARYRKEFLADESKENLNN